LITGIVYRSINAGTFRFADFIVRRIKRILPALYIVILATITAAILLMIPEDMKGLGKAAFFAVTASSNIYFWYSEDTNYFARSSDLLPLLHTWSLGVEEQFYFLWPVALFLLCKAGRTRIAIWTVATVAVLSFAAAEISLRIDPSFSYYMLPTRAGELLIGCFCSLWVEDNTTARGTSRHEWLAIGGAALIGYSLLLADARTSFPGVNSFYPCLGTALVIYAGSFRKTLVSRALSNPVFASIGVISYSLYLWHWPVLAFAKYLFVDPSLGITTLCLAIITALAAFSYRFVEHPLRSATVSRSHVFSFYLICPAALLASVSLYLYRSDGLAHAISTESYRQAVDDRDRYTSPAYAYDYVCQTSQFDQQAFDEKRCIVGAPGVTPIALLWGDSHAAHYVGFLGAIAEHEGFALRNVELGLCPPVFTEDIDNSRGAARECERFRKAVRGAIAAYDVVFIGGRWDIYDSAAFWRAFEDTIDEIAAAGKHVVVLGQPPMFLAYDRDCGLRAARFVDIDCAVLAKSSMKLVKANERVRDIAEARPSVEFLSSEPLVCAGGCSPYQNGVPLYYDATHMSIYGSSKLGRAWIESAPYTSVLSSIDQHAVLPPESH
jgi:peptidoglycan/LPS O-acetylase OafA/YrhL